MRNRGRGISAALSAVTLAAPLLLPTAAGAQSGAAHLDGAEAWTESDCVGDEPIVVGSDAAAQSDIYSAITLAGVVGTQCVVLAGPRDAAMPASQRARLEAAAGDGFVVGGTAAVPDEKLAGRTLSRIAGKDRWTTAQRVGTVAQSLGGGEAPAVALDASLTAPDDVEQPGVHLRGAGPWIASECAGDVPIVVGSDAKAQSDIYNAVTLAGVVGTDCVILAGPRDGSMPASQQARLEAAETGGFVLGGIAAVPTAKISGRDMTRLGGATRWDTAQLVGRRASGDTTAGTSTETEPLSDGSEEPEDGQETGVEDGIPDPILPNQAFIERESEISAFLEECGWWDSDRGGYRQCESPEDTQEFIRMKSDHYGCEYNATRGLCEGLTISEHWQLVSRLACSEGWSLSESYSNEGEFIGFRCYRHDHPDYRPL